MKQTAAKVDVEAEFLLMQPPSDRSTLANAAMMIAFSLLCIAGGVMQNVALNFWIQNFIDNERGGIFTILISSSLFYVVFFVSCFLAVAACVKERLVLRRITREAVACILNIGMFDALNGVLAVFSTPYVPQLLQIIFAAMSSVFTVILSPVLMYKARSFHDSSAAATDDPRTTVSTSEKKRSSALAPLQTICSMVLLIGACLVVAIPHFSEGTSSDTANGSISSADRTRWSLIFIAAFLPGAVYNILQSRVLLITGFDHREPEARCNKWETVLANLAVLAGGCISQLLFMFVFFPLDWAPWFGEFSSESQATTGLREGLQCVTQCPGNFAYFFVFNFGYTLSYVGSQYLNVMSPSFCSLVAQLVTPISAMFLLAVPAWNIHKESIHLAYIAASLVLILLSTALYAFAHAKDLVETFTKPKSSHSHTDLSSQSKPLLPPI
eukprot:ANDGO_04048.mRNA.1 hypothetical protein ABB37_09781